MAVAGINSTLLSYTREKAGIQNQLSTIMFQITSATKNSIEIMNTANSNRAYLADLVYQNPAYADTVEYRVLQEQIEDDYELQLAEINSWEVELEQQKNNLETRLKAINSFEESWTAALKQNIKKDFTYASGGGS